MCVHSKLYRLAKNKLLNICVSYDAKQRITISILSAKHNLPFAEFPFLTHSHSQFESFLPQIGTFEPHTHLFEDAFRQRNTPI
ncbi:hypothetical protein EA004_10895 [Vibrio anguillarum]|uniref:Uncharacterized protein n=1 Tax=Vibrio anguillarum TaxID=55601 RepID=A0ABR9Z6H5_VIBAN|nr:hypothetical protein [Vibrio anguillarum]MBF4373988.1 hypothetical protein [Vibrio anguillarum]